MRIENYEVWIILCFILLIAIGELLWTNQKNIIPLFKIFSGLKKSSSRADLLLTFLSLGPLKMFLLSVFSLGIPIWLYPFVEEFFKFDLLQGVANNYLRIFIALVLIDFIHFIRHYTFHKINFLWTFHKFHHEPARLNVLMHWRSHPFTKVIKKLFYLPFAAMFGLSSSEFAVIFLFRELWFITHHSSLPIRLGLLRFVLITPQYHQHHHIKRISGGSSKNLGNLFTFWDLIFGTACFEEIPESVEFGTIENISPEEPLLDSYLRPFKDIFKQLGFENKKSP